MSEVPRFFCLSCGQYHEGFPMDVGADLPDAWHGIPETKRNTRCQYTADLCIIDNETFYIRGCLEIPVIDGPGPFVWGVWTTLSKKNFETTVNLWNIEGREHEPPYFGWFATSLLGYPETLNLKTLVHTRSIGERPFVELEPTDHPLAIEQRQGIMMPRVQEIVEMIMHGSKK